MKMRVWAMGAALLAGLCVAGPARATPEPPALTVTTKDESTSMTLGLTAQLRVELDHVDKGPGKEAEEDVLVHFRRIRPLVKGSVLTKDLTYQLQVNLVPGAIELIDLYAGYQFHPQAQLLVGQAKVPFTRYRLNSYKDLPLAEWSNETRFFGAERQLGLMLHNGFDKPGKIEYELGLYTGVNQRASDAAGLAQAFGEKLPNPSALVNPAPPPDTIHPELVAHFGYNHGGINVRRPSDLEGGPPRFMVGATAAWDARPTARQDMSLRIAPEALLKAYGFALNGVFYLGFWEKEDHELGSMAQGFTGLVAQASQVLFERFEVAFRYTLVHLTEELRDQAKAYAAEQMAAAKGSEAEAEVKEQYKSVGKVSDEHDLTVGLNVYLLGTALKWQTDASALLHVRPDGDRIDRRIRTQLLVSF
ncbi:MAG: hypothetical protein HY744_13595 [Deltaproteobacteria bacterium]|nr:hypothetical protein [Deltaproteobacteria bacterium]